MVKSESLHRRYILFKCDVELDEKSLSDGLIYELLKFFGEYGTSEACFKLISYDQKNNRGIIRCHRKYLEKMLGFLAILSKLKDIPIRIVALSSSGTIKSFDHFLE